MESDVNIKEGYKKTAVGVIPEEWEVKPFNESFKHLRAYTVSRNELNYDENESCIYNIHYGDIHSTFPNSILDVEKNIKLIPVIINPELETPEFLKEGDLIMADASEDYEGIGKTIELVNVQDSKIVSGTHTFPLRPMTKFAPKYAGYIFTEFSVHKQIKRIATGISVFGVSKANISKIQLPIPPLPEQKAIANCLTTWDSGIEKLSALIKAKKEQKKGLMQQLLTGEKRLDGFEGEWKEMRLSNISLKKSSSLQANSIVENNGEYNVYGATGFLTKLDYYDEEHPYIGIVKDGSGVGNMYLLEAKSSVLGTLDKILPKNSNLVFLYSIMKRLNFGKYKVGGAIPHIYYKDYSKEFVSVPSIEEQTAIANILSTADKEIALLEKKLKRFKEQKRGLMQVLLTGERRLIENC